MKDEGTVTEIDLHEYLRSQFTDLAGAKLFMWKWVNEMDQMIPGFGGLSSRALSAHCSAILEGSDVKTLGGFTTNYLASKHGSELYWAAWSEKP